MDVSYRETDQGVLQNQLACFGSNDDVEQQGPALHHEEHGIDGYHSDLDGLSTFTDQLTINEPIVAENVTGEVIIEPQSKKPEQRVLLTAKRKNSAKKDPKVTHDHDYQVNPEHAAMMAEIIVEQEAKIMELESRMRKKDNLLIKKKAIIKSLRNDLKTLKQACKGSDNQLTDPLLIEMQRNKNRKFKGARYSDDLKNMALVLHYCSPKAYKQMRKYFTLPSISTIKTWLARIDIKDGFSTNILKLLKIRAKCMNDNEKLVSIFLDEISLKERLSYFANANPDYFVGFPSKIPGEKKVNIKTRANSSLTLMIKTIKSGFKQAIGFYFCKNFESRQLKNIVDQALTEVKATGFIPKVVCCDQNSTNRAMYEREFKITEEKPYIEREWGKVYCLYDAPHLLKSIRNNLMKHNAVYKGQICSFQHIEKLYWEDIKTQPRSVPKLKEEHIKLAQFAEMSVSKAAVVLSHSVATGLKSYVSTGKLPQEALNTSQLCNDFDCLFDIANSSVFNTTKDFKRPIKSDSNHLKFLEDMREPIRGMYFVDKKCFSPQEESQFKPLVKQSRKPYCLEGWLLYISALLQLWNELSTTHQFRFLRTRNLQQDCLEHFFSIIRWKNVNNNHPDPARFMSAYKAVVINQLIEPNKLGNVEADVSKHILNTEEIHKLGLIKVHSPREKYHHVNFDNNEADISEPDVNQLSSIYWTTGWVCSQLQHQDCFDRISNGNQNLSKNVTLLSDLKKYDDNSNVVSPNQQAFDYFRGICKTFDDNFSFLLEESPIGVKEELFDIIRVEFEYPSHSDETISDPLVCGIFCEVCAIKLTDKYLNMLIKCKLNNMNVTFKTETEEKKTAKKNQKARKLNIARYRHV